MKSLVRKGLQVSGASSDGRNIYKQLGGSNFLYFLVSSVGRPGGPSVQASSNLWMVGSQPGQDFGGIINRNGAWCPEDASSDWEYYR